MHGVCSLCSMRTGLGKAEFGARWGARHLDRQMSAEIAFDVGSLISLPRSAPGVHAEPRKIARLALAAVGSRDEILRCLPSRAVRYAIQLEPGHHMQIRGAGVVAHGAGKFRLDETRQHPAGNGRRGRTCCGRIGWLGPRPATDWACGSTARWRRGAPTRRRVATCRRPTFGAQNEKTDLLFSFLVLA